MMLDEVQPLPATGPRPPRRLLPDQTDIASDRVVAFVNADVIFPTCAEVKFSVWPGGCRPRSGRDGFLSRPGTPARLLGVGRNRQPASEVFRSEGDMLAES